MVAFLSYSSSNYPVVVPLVTVLTALGQRVPFERKSPGAPARWRRVAADIEASELFITALSSQSLISYTCWLELNYATRLGKRVLPIQLADIDFRKLPPEVEGLSLIDFRKQDEAARAALAKAIRTLPHVVPSRVRHTANLDWMAPLNDLCERIDNLDTNYDEQAAILFNLREFAERRETLEPSAKLLELLATHELFLYPRTATQIERTLNDISKVRVKNRMRRMALAGVAVSVAVAVPVFLLSARSALVTDSDLTPSSALIVQNDDATEATQSPTASPTLTAALTPTPTGTPSRTSSPRPTTAVPALILPSATQPGINLPLATSGVPTNPAATNEPPVTAPTNVVATNPPPTNVASTNVPPTNPPPTNVPPLLPQRK